eukprot:2144090-Alexandrium_andersonii.AAC.1
MAPTPGPSTHEIGTPWGTEHGVGGAALRAAPPSAKPSSCGGADVPGVHTWDEATSRALRDLPAASRRWALGFCIGYGVIASLTCRWRR